MTCHAELVLGAAEFKIISRDLSQETDNDIVTHGFGDPNIGCASLDRTAYPAKEVQLPTGVKANIV